MKIFMDILFLCAIGYLVYRFILVLVKMKHRVIFPVTDEEMANIRKHPDKPLDLPIYSKQKVGITFCGIMLLILVVMFFLGAFLKLFDWSLYFLLLLLVLNTHNLFNQFSVLEDGLLSGNRFIAWKRVKSFELVQIDVNHKYYGFSAEANNGYECIIKVKGFPISCVVTSVEVQEKLTNIFKKHVPAGEGKSLRSKASE